MTIFRIGVVTAIDPARAYARVRFDDLDGLETAMIPVGVRKSLKDRDYWMPDPGEQVAVLLDEAAETGVILCAIYSAADPPPISDPDKFHRRFDDGTVIEYDRKGHKLTVNCAGDVEIRAAGKIQLLASRIDLN